MIVGASFIAGEQAKVVALGCYFAALAVIGL